MKFKKPSKKLSIILGSVVIVIVIAVLIINAYLGSIIEGQIRAALNKNQTNYKIELAKVKFNIISGNLKIYDLSIKPDSAVLEGLKNGQMPMRTVFGAEVPLFKIAGIGYYQALFNKSLVVRKIEIREAHITLFRGKEPKREVVEETVEKHFRTDSIYLKGLEGIKLKRFEFVGCQFALYDLEKKDFAMETGDIDLTLTGMDLIKKEGYDNVFRMGFYNFKMELSLEDFKLPGGWYNLGIKKLTFNMPDSSATIRKIKLWPQYDDLGKMARDQKFTKEIYNLTIDEIKFCQFRARRMIRVGEIFMDSMFISGLDVDMLKDKKYPFNETLRPKLPQQTLKSLNFPLDIKKIRLKDSDLKYQEKMEGKEELMTVTLNNINAEITNVTSVSDSILSGKVLEIHLNTKLMNKAPVDIQFAMPLSSRSDTMFFTGYVGPARMKMFNKATIPALGLKISDGNLNSVNFKGLANSHFSSGEMTMKYEGLESEVYKKDVKETNKFVTWAANAAMHNNNPGKNGKLRVAHMEFDRVMYKGFGNFMWKTLQSGIVNTLAPTGKQKRTVNPDPKKDKSKKSKRKRRKSKE